MSSYVTGFCPRVVGFGGLVYWVLGKGCGLFGFVGKLGLDLVDFM